MTIVIAPAKIHLAQDILDQQADGHFLIDSVLTSVDLSDRVVLSERKDNKIELALDSSFMTENQHNTVYLAAKFFKKQFPLSKGVTIGIYKNIPIGSGLGGGSTDAAAVLRGLNEMNASPLNEEELVELARKIDADAPYALYGGTKHVFGIGEKIEPLPDIPARYVILAKPQLNVSTRMIFKKIKAEEFKYQKRNAPIVIEALKKKDYNAFVHAVGNQLEPFLFKTYPQMAYVKEKMQKFGAEGVMVTGTGSTIIGFTQNERRAKRIVNALKGFCDKVYLTTSLENK